MEDACIYQIKKMYTQPDECVYTLSGLYLCEYTRVKLNYTILLLLLPIILEDLPRFTLYQKYAKY